MTACTQLSDVTRTPATGGCQCGAVRYAIGRLGVASICHCRMCQKAFGGLFAPLVEAGDIVWTRGNRSIFHSSTTNWRGFCSACGTPLTYEHETLIEVAIGTLDNPDLAPPTVQVNPSHRRHFFDTLPDIPAKPEAMRVEDDVWNASVKSHQHPDHDT